MWSPCVARLQRATVIALCALAVVVPADTASAQGQSTEFELSTGAVVFPTPTPAHFSSWPPSAAGPVTDSIAVPFTVDRLQNNTIRVTTVTISCQSVIGPKSCADFEWRNGATGAWQALTLIDAEVESRLVIPLLYNDPWSGTLWLRCRINWNDPAPSLITSNIRLTLEVRRL